MPEETFVIDMAKLITLDLSVDRQPLARPTLPAAASTHDRTTYTPQRWTTVSSQTPTSSTLPRTNNLGHHDPKPDRLIRECPQLSQGVGTLVTIKAKIHIDDPVQPVALLHRRVPFRLRQGEAAEVQGLEDPDIIEDFSGPTPWFSPLVAVERKSGDIRVCIDMRQANVAAKGERLNWTIS